MPTSSPERGWLALIVFLGGCPDPRPATPADTHEPAPDSGDTSDDTDEAADDTAVVGGDDTGEAPPPELYCPEGTAAVRDDLGEPVYCIDLYESAIDGGEMGAYDQWPAYPDGSTTAVAQSVAGVLPETLISWYQATAICMNAGKYLCSSEEWRDGCDGVIGEGGPMFPWGEAWSDDVCATVTQEGEQQYPSLQPTGSMERCVSPVGAYDLVGNAWEWSDPLEEDAARRPVADKRGGAYYSGQGSSQCDASMFGHPPDFYGTVAARCCMTPLVR